jgi:hypothetical protein
MAWQGRNLYIPGTPGELNEAIKDAIVSAPMDERHHPLEILDEAVR